MKLRWRMSTVAVVSSLLLLPAAPALAGGLRVLVVDDDGVQCAGAEYRSIQPAVDDAEDGDTIRVCGGSYREDVTVRSAVRLVAQLPAAGEVDCLNGGPIPVGASVLIGELTLGSDATGSRIDGFVVTGARTGITTSEQGAGYQLRRNVVEGNTAFGIELQSSGDRTTIVEKNCVRSNGTEIGLRAGLASELGTLRNAVIRNNLWADNFEAISVAGPHPHADISISQNIVRREGIAVFVSGIVSGSVDHNDIDSTGAASAFGQIVIGGGNVALLVDSNTVIGGTPSISVNRAANDTNPDPNIGLVISRNNISNSGSGINITLPDPGALPNLTQSLLYRNTAVGGRNSGIVLAPGNNNNLLAGNRMTDNARYGIWLPAVPGYPPVTGTVAVGNTMLGNGVADARDDNFVDNAWFANTCITQIPADAGMCNTGQRIAPSSARLARADGVAIPPVPALDRSAWPCLRVAVPDLNTDHDLRWTSTTVVAPDAPPSTSCGS